MILLCVLEECLSIYYGGLGRPYCICMLYFPSTAVLGYIQMASLPPALEVLILTFAIIIVLALITGFVECIWLGIKGIVYSNHLLFSLTKISLQSSTEAKEQTDSRR